MHLWEFNHYVKGYEEVLVRNARDLVTVAYHTAAFTNSKKRPKSLKHYLDKIKSSSDVRKINDVVDTQKSKGIMSKISQLMNK